MTDQTPPSAARKARRNGTTVLVLASIVGGMVGLAYASVPLYRLFCQVTGYGGTPGKEAGTHVAVPGAREIVVRFDSNVSPKLAWRFKPDQRDVHLKVGETTLATYTARNLSDHAITGTALFNVTPYKAGEYFNKIDCFCFTEQTLEPGQEVSMPVSFFVDPEIYDDPTTRDVTTITLSYTFYPVTKTADVKASGAATDGPAGAGGS